MKSIFITGAAQGIGRATAELFMQRGWRVGGCDVDEAKLAGLPWSRRVDVTKADEITSAVDAFASEGGLDVMFNNAGVLSMGAFHEMPVEKLVRTVDVNVRGVVLSARAALPHLIASQGVMVSMGSASGIYGTADIAAYSASKFFVRGLTEALDVELAGTGVRVVDIMPAFVDTDMVRKDQQGSTSVAKLGVHLTPVHIAEEVWVAVTTRARGHRIPQFKMRMFRFVSGMWPSLGRSLARGNR